VEPDTGLRLFKVHYEREMRPLTTAYHSDFSKHTEPPWLTVLSMRQEWPLPGLGRSATNLVPPTVDPIGLNPFDFDFQTGDAVDI
jgi:hypothetical protein